MMDEYEFNLIEYVLNTYEEASGEPLKSHTASSYVGSFIEELLREQFDAWVKRSYSAIYKKEEI